MTVRHWLGIAACALFALGGCATKPQPVSIADTAAARPELSTLNKLVKDAGLTEELSGSGPYTVFAPTDEAFKSVPPATMAKLSSDKEALKSVLNFHVINGKVPAAEVKNGSFKTLQGSNVALSKSGDFVTVEDAVVTQPDVPATNGVVHVIDRVLIPPTK